MAELLAPLEPTPSPRRLAPVHERSGELTGSGRLAPGELAPRSARSVESSLSRDAARRRSDADVAAFLDAFEVDPAVGFWRDPLALGDFKPRELRRQLPRVLFAAGFWCSCVYFNSICQAYLQRTMSNFYADNWMPRPPHKAPHPVILYDFGHALLGKLDMPGFPDVMAGGGAIIAMVRFVVIPGPLSLRWTVLRRWLFLFGILFFLRGISIVVTVLPNPDLTCKPRISHDNNLFLEAWDIFINRDLTCTDVLYSGHTVAATLAYTFFVEYSARAPYFVCSYRHRASWFGAVKVFQVLALGYLLTAYYAIIATHFHYTCDVFIGACMTFFVSQGYRYWIEVADEHAAGLSPSRLLCWLERYAPDMRLRRMVRAQRAAAKREADAAILQVAQQLDQQGLAGLTAAERLHVIRVVGESLTPRSDVRSASPMRKSGGDSLLPEDAGA